MRRAAILGLMCGCSFAFVSGPPPNHRQLPYFSCTESRLVPILDTVFTALEAANLGLAIHDSPSEWDARFGSTPHLSRNSSIPFYIALAALGGGGMYYGYSRVSACESARGELMMRLQNQPPPAAPAPAPAPPP